jgi:hypothetical protein
MSSSVAQLHAAPSDLSPSSPAASADEDPSEVAASEFRRNENDDAATSASMAAANTRSSGSMEYAEKHGIFPLLEELIEALIYEHPEEPIGFLADLLQGRIDDTEGAAGTSHSKKADH